MARCRVWTPASIGFPAVAAEYVFALPSGRVAIRRLQTAGAQTSRYDIIDRQGALSAIMEVALAERIVGFGPTHVYTVIKDPDTDLESIVRYSLAAGRVVAS